MIIPECPLSLGCYSGVSGMSGPGCASGLVQLYSIGYVHGAVSGVGGRDSVTPHAVLGTCMGQPVNYWEG